MMHCNQPFFNSPYECNFVPIVPRPVPYQRVIGEGNIRQIVLPDGSVHLYFVPANWDDQRPYQFNANSLNIPYFQGAIYREPWFVRNLSYSMPVDDHNQVHTGFLFPAPQFTSKCCLNPPPYTEYTQKFHNDNTTSTTDIFYFYPNLRQRSFTKDCAVVQTEIPTNNFYHGAVYDGPCYCRTNRLAEKETNYTCACKKGLNSSVSFMSVDEEIQPKRILKNKKISTSCSKIPKKTKSGHQVTCKCSKYTTDKSVTTFADKGCGFMVKDGRQTQTTQRRSKRSDIKTDVWTVRNKRRSKYKSSSRSECNSCHSSCCSSSDCEC